MARTASTTRKYLVPYCVDFDGGDTINMGDAAALDVAFPQMTLEAWISRDASQVSEAEVVGKNYTAYELGIISSDRLKVDFTIGGTQFTAYSTNDAAGKIINDGTWYHIAAVYDGANVHLYKNGVECSADAYAYTGNVGVNDSIFTIGSRIGTVLFFDGKIAQVRIWNKGLNVADLLLHYKNAYDTTCANTAATTYAANCVAHYPMTSENGTGTKLHDIKGASLGTFGATTTAPTWSTATGGIPAKRTAATTRTAVNYPKELSTTSYNGTANLKAYYRFKNGTELLDETANDSDLTAIGVPVQATPRWGTGCVGLGTSQAFSAVDAADFRPAGNWSISSWIRTVKNGTQIIAQSFSQNTNIAGILFYVAGTVLFLKSGKNSGTTEDTDFKNLAGSTAVNDNVWHHAVATYDGAKIHLYLDGAEQGTGAVWTNAAAFAATNYVRVGCLNDAGTNSAYFMGCLDEVSFYPSDALSLAQVQSLYAASITDASNSAIKALASAVYLFNEGGQLVDSSTGAENTLTAIGTPTTCTTKFGGSVFLGNSSAYSVVDAAVLKPTGAFSVGGWVKTTATGIYQYIFQSYSQNTQVAGFRININDGTNGLQIWSGKNSGAGAGVENTDWKRVTSTTNICDGNWHFVVAVWDTSYIKLYVDGVSAVTPAAWANAPAYAATNYVRVGCKNEAGTNANYFPGQLDDIFLLNGTALTADEVNYLYMQRKAVL
jgi:hypothetical protein